MTQMIFVNLPVTDLKASMTFYEAIGFTNNPQFTDETAAAMAFSDTITVMLLTHGKWREFTDLSIPDAHKSAQVMLAISSESRESVDAIAKAASAHGGNAEIRAAQDYGWMYSRAFADPDGHIWEPMWMDAAAMAGGKD